MSPDPVECPECKSTQIGHTTKGGGPSTSMAMPTPSGFMPMMHNTKAQKFFNVCQACGYEWSPADRAAAAARWKADAPYREAKLKADGLRIKAKMAADAREQEGRNRTWPSFRSWRQKLLMELSPILGNEKENFSKFLETRYFISGWRHVATLDEYVAKLDELIRPPFTNSHPWIKYKKTSTNNALNMFIVMAGAYVISNVLFVLSAIAVSRVEGDFVASTVIILFGIFVGAPILAVFAAIALTTSYLVNKSQKELKSCYNPRGTRRQSAGPPLLPHKKTDGDAVVAKVVSPSDAWEQGITRLQSVQADGKSKRVKYFIKRGVNVFGPFSVKQINRGLKSNKLTAKDEVSLFESGPWERLQDFSI